MHFILNPITLMKKTFYATLAVLVLLASYNTYGQSEKLKARAAELANKIEPKVIEWRHHVHQNPELSNREYKTAEYIANHLKSLGMDVETGIAHTGVVGTLIGGKPGPVVALRLILMHSRYPNG